MKKMLKFVRRHLIGNVLSASIGLVFAMMFLFLFPVFIQSATFQGGWSSEWLVGTFSHAFTPSYVLVSTGTDTSLVIEQTSYVIDRPLPEISDPGGIPPEIAGETGQPGITEDFSSMSSHPFYPLVNAIAENTSIPEQQVWVIGALFLVLAATLAGYVYAPHQLITASIGTTLVIAFWLQGIWAFWVIIIYVMCALAILLWERVPSI